MLVAFSVVFAAAAVPDLPGAGALLFLAVGVAGILVFAGILVSLTGQLAGGRPVLELDDRGVRLPAPWPWSRARDRFLPWPEVAAAVVWDRPVQRGRRGVTDHLAFLPTPGHAERTGPPPSPELVALRLDGLPGVTTTRWSIPVLPGWDIEVDEVIDAIRGRGLPTADARSR